MKRLIALAIINWCKQEGLICRECANNVLEISYPTDYLPENKDQEFIELMKEIFLPLKTEKGWEMAVFFEGRSDNYGCTREEALLIIPSKWVTDHVFKVQLNSIEMDRMTELAALNDYCIESKKIKKADTKKKLLDVGYSQEKVDQMIGV